MIRYLFTRYGEIDSIKIPDVVPSGSLNIKENFFDRNKSEYIQDNIVVINRINKYKTGEFVKKIIDVRKKYWDKILYLPSYGLMYDYPILFYLGIDILDDLPIKIMGDEKCITEFGIIEGNNCLSKNNIEKERMVERIRLAIENSKLRELVEAYSISAFSKEALRIIDSLYYKESEPFLDFRNRSIRANSIESLSRPEIQYFRQKVIKLKQTSKNLLLIPCSAVKPYSRSKTHKILHSRIYPYLSGIQEVIVTSPLGLVPRELEDLFPVRNYDIPVTGHWFEEEKEMLRKVAISYFKDKKYENVFYVLNGEESDFLSIFESAEGIIGNLNFENSDKISRIISSHHIEKNRSAKKKLEFANIISYLYDVDIENENIEFKEEGNRIIVKNKEGNLIKKTISGVYMEEGLANMLLKKGKRIIEVNGRFNGSNIYIPGIKSISDDVRPGNEIAILMNGEIIGRGIAGVSNLDLKLTKKGIGITDVSYF